MKSENKIISVDQIRHDAVLIYLQDGTVLQITVDQLLNSGLPRYRVAPDDKSFEVAIANALNRSLIN